MVLACGDGSSSQDELNASDPSLTSLGGQEPFVRPCEVFIKKPERMFVDHPSDLTFGELTFRGLRSLSNRGDAELFKTTPGLAAKWRAFKALVTIEGGAGATISIPIKDQRHFLLGYDPAHYKGRGPRNQAWVKSDGQPAVRFGRCAKGSPEGESEFIGRVLARRPGCYRVRVHVGEAPKPLVRTVNVAMGAKKC